MRVSLVLPFLALALAAAWPAPARAAAVIRIDESRSLSIAVAFRSSLGGTTSPAADGSSRALDLSVDGAVLAIGGELDKRLRLQINALRVPTTGVIAVADAIVMIDVAPWLQLWAGRMLPPLDRAALTGPFFGVQYEPPAFASAYPSLLPGGRDDGLAAWGTFLDGRLKYQLGAYRGRVGAPNLLAFPMFAARVSYSFWDPEPGYYAAATYLGARKTLTLAVHGRYQRDGLKFPDDTAGRYLGFGADALLERDLGPLIGTLEIGAARYDALSSADPLAFDGTGAYASLAGMGAQPLGPGRLQLGARYQWLTPVGGPPRAKLDGVANYFMAGQSIRLVGLLSRELPPGAPSIYAARFAIQLVL